MKILKLSAIICMLILLGGCKKTITTKYSNGNLKEKYSVTQKNVKDGVYTLWFENGNKDSETNYKNGIENGVSSAWYESGKIGLIANCKDGKLDGLMTSWYENGQKKAEKMYKDGQEISSKEWNEDGTER